MARVAFAFLSIRFAGPNDRPRPNARIFAIVNGRRFEFVRLDSPATDAPHVVEAYDFPRSWEGLPRFVGYLPSEAGAKLIALAREAIRDARVNATRYTNPLRGVRTTVVRP